MLKKKTLLGHAPRDYNIMPHMTQRRPTVAKLTQLVTDKDRITEDTLLRAVELLGEFNDQQMPAYARERLRNELCRLTKQGHREGVFVMLSVAQTAEVWRMIRYTEGLQNREQVRHAFDIVLTNLRQDTGEVMLTRDEIADLMRCTAKEVSMAMGELAKLGVIEKEIRRVPGMKGPGIVAYFINADVAWNGNRNIRRERATQQAQRSLRLVSSDTDNNATRKRNRARPIGDLITPIVAAIEKRHHADAAPAVGVV